MTRNRAARIEYIPLALPMHPLHSRPKMGSLQLHVLAAPTPVRRAVIMPPGSLGTTANLDEGSAKDGLTHADEDRGSDAKGRAET
jgi:hypothetical protein